MVRRASKGSDPLLTTTAWRTTIRQHHIRLGLPCARCGQPIQYGAPRYLPGTTRVNPRSLVVGHIVGRDAAKRMGWSNEQINALNNTQAECARCSDRSGAVYGNRKRSTRKRALNLDTSRVW